MGSLLAFDLNIDAGVDYAALLTILGNSGAQVCFGGPGGPPTASLAIKVSPLDAAPIVQIVNALYPTAGTVALGIAPPAPVGANVVNLASLEQAGYPLSLVVGPPSAVVAQAATIAAMAALSTTGVTVGEACLVLAGPGSFFQWSPADPLTPNGVTIVASAGPGPAGNWLLAPTVALSLTAAATSLLAGYATAFYDLVLTWADGSALKLLSGVANVVSTENPIGAGAGGGPVPLPPLGGLATIFAYPGSTTLPANTRALAQTGGGPCTILLDVGAFGNLFAVKDNMLDCSTNNITVTPPAGTALEDPNNPGAFQAIGSSCILNINGQSAVWVSDGLGHYSLAGGIT